MRVFFVLSLAGALVTPAAAAAQPLALSASVAVTWLNPISAPSDHAGENPPSLGVVSHPALVVLWRGQPGWVFANAGPANSVSFEGSSRATPAGESSHSIAVSRGGVRLELEYGRHERAVHVNGVPVVLPEGHNVILLDRVDEQLEVFRTLMMVGREPEPVEVFLGRSPELREFVRCGVPLPEDVFAELGPELAEHFRGSMQRGMDERCELLMGS